MLSTPDLKTMVEKAVEGDTEMQSLSSHAAPNHGWTVSSIQIIQLHKSTVFVMLMDVIMPTIIGILSFMSMTSSMNVLRLICHAGGC